uniref:Uncharacterized protein n=1 Tax=Anguilla anguilla TaxID=7936 RepID=A0A0E9U936_ANGAN
MPSSLLGPVLTLKKPPLFP